MTTLAVWRGTGDYSLRSRWSRPVQDKESEFKVDDRAVRRYSTVDW